MGAATTDPRIGPIPLQVLLLGRVGLAVDNDGARLGCLHLLPPQFEKVLCGPQRVVSSSHSLVRNNDNSNYKLSLDGANYSSSSQKSLAEGNA